MPQQRSSHSIGSHALLAIAVAFGLVVHVLGLGGCADGSGSRHLFVVVDHPDMSPWLAQGSEGGLPFEWISDGPVFVPHDASTECVPSWNIDVSDGWSCAIDVRAQVGRLSSDAQAEEWSSWMQIGSWGAEDRYSPLALGDSVVNPANRLRVDVDTLVIGEAHRSMTAVQLRVRAWSAETTGRGAMNEGESGIVPQVRVRRLASCFSPAPAPTEAPFTTDQNPSIPATATKRILLDVPFRSQRTGDPTLAGRLCSPTSVTMALAYFGQQDLSVEEVARRVYDAPRNIYGNWSRNVQAAYALGAPGYVRRFNSWREVEQALGDGTPIIASITAYKGELRGAPYEQSGGHLIVITGLDGRGGVYVNDPAASSAETGQLVYRQHDLDRVWLRRKQGTAYIFDPREPDARASTKDLPR